MGKLVILLSGVLLLLTDGGDELLGLTVLITKNLIILLGGSRSTTFTIEII